MPARARTKSASKELQTRSKEKSTRTDDAVSDIEKETGSRTARSRTEAHAKPMHTYCVCNQPDDGSPMVCCSHCSDWCVPLPATSILMVQSLLKLRFHFRCVKLSLEQAEDIGTSSLVAFVFLCSSPFPPCRGVYLSYLYRRYRSTHDQ
jgi:hypothetical protein